MAFFIFSGSKKLAFSDKKCTVQSYCSYKEMKTKSGREITLLFGKSELKFNVEDTGVYDFEYLVCKYHSQSENELKWYSIEQVIGIFEKLIIFLYNSAVAIGHVKFQQEIKTLITELVSTYEKGIVMMRQYQEKFDAVLRGKGKWEHEQHIYHIFYEGFEQLADIYVNICDIHEKLTDLQKALNEAAELE